MIPATAETVCDPRRIRRDEGETLHEVFSRTREIRRGGIDPQQHIAPNSPKNGKA